MKDDYNADNKDSYDDRRYNKSIGAYLYLKIGIKMTMINSNDVNKKG
jgi:hypothetical protein